MGRVSTQFIVKHKNKTDLSTAFTFVQRYDAVIDDGDRTGVLQADIDSEGIESIVLYCNAGRITRMASHRDGGCEQGWLIALVPRLIEILTIRFAPSGFHKTREKYQKKRWSDMQAN